MTRRAALAGILLGALLFLFPGAAVGLTPNVGHHTHVQVTGPMPDSIVDGKVNFGITVLSHNQIGTIVDVRLDRGPGTVIQRWPVNLAPCGAACTYSFTATVDFSSWPTGRQELRWRGEIPKSTDQEQNSSSGYQLCVRSCSPTYRSGPFLEARGWYTGHGYQNARLTSSIGSLTPGGTIKVSLAPGSGGKATKEWQVALNPDYHNGSHGTLLASGTGSFKGSIHLPDTLVPGDKLILLASDGQDAGVLLIVVPEAGATTLVWQDQAWWARESLVLP